MHRHFFTGATTPLRINTGEMLVCYVSLDGHPPTQVMLEWHDGSSWEHRAYWGADLVAVGTNDTDSRRPKGPLPPPGRWVRLEVLADDVGLGNAEGTRTVSGMSTPTRGWSRLLGWRRQGCPRWRVVERLGVVWRGAAQGATPGGDGESWSFMPEVDPTLGSMPNAEPQLPLAGILLLQPVVVEEVTGALNPADPC